MDSDPQPWWIGSKKKQKRALLKKPSKKHSFKFQRKEAIIKPWSKENKIKHVFKSKIAYHSYASTQFTPKKKSHLQTTTFLKSTTQQFRPDKRNFFTFIHDFPSQNSSFKNPNDRGQPACIDHWKKNKSSRHDIYAGLFNVAEYKKNSSELIERQNVYNNMRASKNSRNWGMSECDRRLWTGKLGTK